MSPFEIVMLTTERLPEALEILRNSFFKEEIVCAFLDLCDASNADAVEELASFNERIAQDNVSIVAVDGSTQEVLAVAFNKIQVRPAVNEPNFFEEYTKSSMKTKKAASICDFMERIESKMNLFDHFNADCCIDLMTLAVKPSARGRGLARELIRGTIKVAKEYQGDPKPAFVSAIFTSKYSQAAGVAAGMTHLAEIKYAELDCDGRKFPEAVSSEHPLCTLSAIKV